MTVQIPRIAKSEDYSFRAITFDGEQKRTPASITVEQSVHS